MNFLKYVYIILSLLLFSNNLIAQTNEDCQACHEDPDLEGERQGRRVSMYVNFEKFSESVHAGLVCINCHGDADVEEFPHDDILETVKCGDCHDDAQEQFMSGVHGEFLVRGSRYAPTCEECHGTHNILKPDNPKSRTYKMNIPVLCGNCHKEGAPVARIYNISEHNILKNYSQSIHGEGLFKQGLIVSATCNDCHGNHKILPHTKPESSTSVQNIAQTCMQCHVKIEEVHTKIIRGELWSASPNAIPACSDCHQPHKVKKENLVLRTSDKECLSCHGKSELKGIEDKEKSYYIKRDHIQQSVHKNIPCVKCHSDVDPQLHRPCTTVDRVDCSGCHAETSNAYFSSDHGQAFRERNENAPYCTDCHGTHLVYSHRDDRDKTYRTNIPKLCGDCHKSGETPSPVSKEESDTDVLVDYSTSVHGQSLFSKGLLPSAVCTDCHNSHEIYAANNKNSSVHHANVSATCASCHKGIFEKFENSIHNPVNAKSDAKLPTCEDCHSAHTIKHINLDAFQSEVTYQCGSCHKDLSETYLETMHGKAYTLGMVSAAKCSDCHGSHDIREVDDPDSKVGYNKVVETCQQCHADANRRFTGYLSHATHHDRKKYPALFFTFWAMTILLISVFTFFGIHTLLWLPRSFRQMIAKREHGEIHKRYYIQRFTPGQRLTHLFVILSFVALALTGMMLKFAAMPWAKFLADLLGGVAVAGNIHRFAAIITFGYFFAHIIMLLRIKKRKKKSWIKLIFDSDSLMFNKKDILDFFGNLKWFVGFGKRPDYSRWTYWEKFDYFAVFWGVAVIGFSGLILWFPEFFTKFFPGWFINVATIIHSDEALLAVGFIFTIHFFNTHLRPEAFPMDPVIFTGLVPLDEYKKDRPEAYKRLKESGQLKKKVVFTDISHKRMMMVKIFGFTFLFIGLTLVVLIIYSMLFGYL